MLSKNISKKQITFYVILALILIVFVVPYLYNKFFHAPLHTS